MPFGSLASHAALGLPMPKVRVACCGSRGSRRRSTAASVSSVRSAPVSTSKVTGCVVDRRLRRTAGWPASRAAFRRAGSAGRCRRLRRAIGSPPAHAAMPSSASKEQDRRLSWRGADLHRGADGGAVGIQHGEPVEARPRRQPRRLAPDAIGGQRRAVDQEASAAGARPSPGWSPVPSDCQHRTRRREQQMQRIGGHGGRVRMLLHGLASRFAGPSAADRTRGTATAGPARCRLRPAVACRPAARSIPQPHGGSRSRTPRRRGRPSWCRSSRRCRAAPKSGSGRVSTSATACAAPAARKSGAGAGWPASRRSGPPVPSVASAAYSAAASRSVMPSPPSASGSDGSAPWGSRSVAPAKRSVAAKRSGPTRSSSATAGRFSERRSASAAVMLPAKPRSKFSGA